MFKLLSLWVVINYQQALIRKWLYMVPPLDKSRLLTYADFISIEYIDYYMQFTSTVCSGVERIFYVKRENFLHIFLQSRLLNCSSCFRLHSSSNVLVIGPSGLNGSHVLFFHLSSSSPSVNLLTLLRCFMEA